MNDQRGEKKNVSVSIYAAIGRHLLPLDYVICSLSNSTIRDQVVVNPIGRALGYSLLPSLLTVWIRTSVREVTSVALLS